MLYPLDSGSVDIIINKSIKNYFSPPFWKKRLRQFKMVYIICNSKFTPRDI